MTTWSEPPTAAQQNAAAVLQSIYRTRAIELTRLFQEWLDTPFINRGSFLQRTNPTQQFLIGILREAYRDLHRAYGGLAPTDVTVPLIQDYYADLGPIPDAGELAELEHRGKRGVVTA